MTINAHIRVTKLIDANPFKSEKTEVHTTHIEGATTHVKDNDII